MLKAPKVRDTSQKRNEILSAAIQIFVEEGFDTASMDRIALRANASKRTVYNHFSSKEELFNAVIAQLVSEQHALKQIPFNPKQTLEQQLSDFADAQLFMVSTPTRLGMTRIINTIFTRNPSQAAAARAEHGGTEDSLERWIRQAIDANAINAPDPALAAKVFYAMIEGALAYPALTGCTDPASDALLKQELIETFLSRYRKQTTKK